MTSTFASMADRAEMIERLKKDSDGLDVRQRILDISAHTGFDGIEPNDLREEGRQYLGRVEDTRGLYSVDATFQHLLKRPSITLSTFR